MDSTCLLMSKSYCSPDDGQYVPSQVRITYVLSVIWSALWFWLEKTRTVHHLRSYVIFTWEGTYCSSSGELYDFDLRTQVVSIIWKALWFWPEKTRTVHHLGSYMILTWEDTYCPSSGELYDFDLRRHVLSIIWGAIWFCQNHIALQMMDSTFLLR
jgi:uncharacterized protein YjiS (DUF1127 family)